MTTGTISLSLPSTETVSAEHFGVNFIDAYEAIDKSWADLNDFLDGGAADMGLTSLRWPGGADIEDYEITGTTTGDVELSAMGDLGTGAKTLSLGNGSADNTQNENLGTFLEFCDQNSITATLIIPTAWLADLISDEPSATEIEQAKDAITAFIERALALDTGNTITGFEIGNEYQKFFTPAEYAEVLNLVVPVVNEALGENDADIIAQMRINTKDGEKPTLDSPSDQYDLSRYNEHGVLSHLDDGVANMIDGLASHFYYQEGQETDYDTNSEWIHEYDNIDDIIAQVAEMASVWGDNIDLHMTEWGVSQKTLEGEEANFGLKQLAPTLEMFSAMIKYGVDSADIWPLLYNDTSLSKQTPQTRRAAVRSDE